MSSWQRLGKWLTVTLPQQCSAWLLHSYRRPVGLFVGLIVVPFVLTVGVTYAVTVSLWRQRTMENLRVTARLGAEILSETLEETLNLERLVAAQPAFVEAVERADTAALVQHLQDALHFIRRVNIAAVVSPEGRVLAAMPDEHGITGKSLADHESFRTSLESGWEPSISGVSLREGLDIEKVVSVGCPIRRDERVIGLLQVQQRIEEIKSWLQKIRVDPNGFLYVVDQHDQLVVFPYQMVPGKPMVVSHWPPVAHPLSNDGGTVAFTSERTGHRWLAGMYPVGGIGWRVVTVQPEADVLRMLRGVFGVLGFLVLMAIGLIAAVGSRWLRVHAFSLQLLQQNARVLKQLQQRRFYGQGDAPLTDDPEPPS